MSEIKLLYFSNACPEEAYNRIFTGERKPSQAGQKYHALQIAGFVENGAEVKALCIPPISRKTYSGLWFHLKERFGVYYFAPVLNLPILRNILLFLYVFFFVLREGKGADALVCDVLNGTSCAAVLLAKKFTKQQVLGIVTDVSTKRAVQVKNPVKKLLSRISYKMLASYHKYVFLTQDMNTLININNRPYLVAEGHVDHKAEALSNTLEGKYEKKVCLYAGSLHRIYGIEYLVNAFLKADVENSELHIYGGGEYAEELRKLSQIHKNIRFFGLQPNSHIVVEETKATLLVNPRPTGEEYTRYSFPSKNMEYMVSGTPVLSTKLPGMPKEYYPYVYLIEEENAEYLALRLRHLLMQSPETLHAFGMEARMFVLETKNNVRQSARILQLLES